MTIDRFRAAKPCRVFVLTSPKAGSGASREQVPRLLQLLKSRQVEAFLIHELAELLEHLDLARESHSPVIVAAGGDGTLSLVASSICPDIPIVPMPLGTENLLARYYGHRAAAEAVIETIRHGRPHQIDAGMAGGRPFLIMATCGFDAEVVRGMHLTRRGHIRRLSYLLPIFRAVRDYAFPAIEVRVDGGDPIECGWVMVFNLPGYAMGLEIEPAAIADDGQLDVVAFKGRALGDGLRYLAGIMTSRHGSFRDVVRRRGSKIDITSERRVPYQIDGDYGGRLPLGIQALPGRVCLLLPPDSGDQG